ncbi:hypothetical protein ACKKBF_B30800 [Auxenochlorella protothecoides x Auxenochlorella symbiontica]
MPAREKWKGQGRRYPACLIGSVTGQGPGAQHARQYHGSSRSSATRRAYVMTRTGQRAHPRPRPSSGFRATSSPEAEAAAVTAAPPEGLASGAVGASLAALPASDLETPTPGFASIAAALAAIAAGELVLVLDSEDRENEGDLIGAADRITTRATAFLVRHTSGVVCVGMRGADLDRLRLPLMVHSAENEEGLYTAFTVTVDARHGITTGISAEERGITLRALGNPATRAQDLRRPGHIFPLRARPGGVLQRPGHTEAGVDLTLLAGCFPAGALAEVVNDDEDGTMARAPQLAEFAARHGLLRITIADLVRYRLRHGPLLADGGAGEAAQVALGWGPRAVARVFTSLADGSQHVLVCAAEPGDGAPTLALRRGDVAGGAAGALAPGAPGVVVLLDVPRQLSGRRLEAYVAAALGRAAPGVGAAAAPAGVAAPNLMQAALTAHMLRAAGIHSVRVAEEGLAAMLRAHGLDSRG